jgi:hypothetical protein
MGYSETRGRPGGETASRNISDRATGTPIRVTPGGAA